MKIPFSQPGLLEYKVQKSVSLEQRKPWGLVGEQDTQEPLTACL